MDLVGEFVTSGAPDEIWMKLVDPEILRTCIPGCTQLEHSDDGRFVGKMTVKVGPVTATFSGTVMLTDMVRPVSCRLEGQGQGGAAGFVKGEALISLERVPDGTLLRYDASVQIGGKMASVGNRLFGSVAKRNIEEFFSRFSAISSPALAGKTLP